MNNRERLKDALKKELYVCRLLYTGRAVEAEIAALAEAWTMQLEDCWGFPGDEKHLHEAFIWHTQNESYMPRPCHIRPAMLHAKPDKQKPRAKSKPQTPALAANTLKALRGDAKALAMCEAVWGKARGGRE